MQFCEWQCSVLVHCLIMKSQKALWLQIKFDEYIEVVTSGLHLFEGGMDLSLMSHRKGSNLSGELTAQCTLVCLPIFFCSSDLERDLHHNMIFWQEPYKLSHSWLQICQFYNNVRSQLSYWNTFAWDTIWAVSVNPFLIQWKDIVDLNANLKIN